MTEAKEEDVNLKLLNKGIKNNWLGLPIIAIWDKDTGFHASYFEIITISTKSRWIIIYFKIK